jgi:hypothetical protein
MVPFRRVVVPGFFITWPWRLGWVRLFAQAKEPGARPMCPGAKASRRRKIYVEGSKQPHHSRQRVLCRSDVAARRTVEDRGGDHDRPVFLATPRRKLRLARPLLPDVPGQENGGGGAGQASESAGAEAHKLRCPRELVALNGVGGPRRLIFSTISYLTLLNGRIA